jgi:hypothetical protein
MAGLGERGKGKGQGGRLSHCGPKDSDEDGDNSKGQDRWKDSDSGMSRGGTGQIQGRTGQGRGKGTVDGRAAHSGKQPKTAGVSTSFLSTLSLPSP